MDQFNYSIFQFSTTTGLIEPDDKIIISISGGIDSVSLFCLLDSFREKINLDLHLVHFHHGLRQASDEEEAFLLDLSKKKSTPISIIKASHLQGEKGMQNKARQWRYQHLNETLQRTGFTKIALGHHLNDLVETQIWKLMRGGSLFSLNPMLPIHLPYIRPLLHTRKEELKNYLNDIRQDWREDDSNASDDYTRNLIRNLIIPQMQECAGNQLEEKFLALNNDALLLKQQFEATVSENLYTVNSVDFDTITNLPPLFACELIHRYLLYQGQEEINRANIQQIYDLVCSNRGNWKITLKNNRTVLGKHKKICMIDS